MVGCSNSNVFVYSGGFSNVHRVLVQKQTLSRNHSHGVRREVVLKTNIQVPEVLIDQDFS